MSLSHSNYDIFCCFFQKVYHPNATVKAGKTERKGLFIPAWIIL